MDGVPMLESVFAAPQDASFYELAPLYDFVYQRGFDYQAQASLVREHISGQGVLELACGTGLLAERLNREYAYLGLDASMEMLELARRRVAAPFIVADARRYCLDRRFGVVAMLGRSASHFGADDLTTVATRARRHVADGPVLLDAHDRAALQDEYTSDARYQSDRWSVAYRGRSDTTGGGWCRHRYEYEVTDRASDRCRTFEGSYRMRFWGVDELGSLLRDAGFETVSIEATDGVVRAVASPP